MSDLVTVRVIVNNHTPFSTTLKCTATVDNLRGIIRQSQDVSSFDEVLLMANGKVLKHPNTTMTELGIRNDTMIKCVISNENGRKTDKQRGDNEEELRVDRQSPYQTVEQKADLEVKLHRRFGIVVWANEKGENAIVTEVVGDEALRIGIKIGYCVYKLGDKIVYNHRYKEILKHLKDMPSPLEISFLDLGQEYSITFRSKPLGFTVVKDSVGNNAKVSKIHTRKALEAGVKIGSYIIEVNEHNVFGKSHRKIISIIGKSLFPLHFRFRRPPKLLLVSKYKDEEDEKRSEN